MARLTRRSFIGMVAMAAGACALRARGVLAEAEEADEYPAFIKRAGLTFHPKSDWTAAPSREDRLRRWQTFDRLTVHHSGELSRDRSEVVAVQRLQGMLAEHKSRGYGDVGYHFVLDPAGRVWEGRSLAFEGAHVVGQNESNIGVVVMGDYDHQELAQPQKDALGLLVGCLRERFGIKLHRVYGHSDLGQTMCPGRNVHAWVTALKG